jgi:uncharacterized membrane protein
MKTPASKAESDKMTKPASPPRRLLPKMAISWWALLASAVGIASWVVLPVITSVYRHTYPITDTWVMPAIGTVLIDVAAILNGLVIWRCGERSLSNIGAAVVVILMALLFTLMVVGESLAGV